MLEDTKRAYCLHKFKKEFKKEKNAYPKFSNVIGLNEAKQFVQEKLLEPSKQLEINKEKGCKIGGGILLYGLQGTGKTLFAQAVANELDGEFYSINTFDSMSKRYDEFKEKIKSLFEEVRKEKVSVIFIDTIDNLEFIRDKTETGDYITASSTVIELLEQLQSFKQERENILLVIATTNSPWTINPSLISSRIFDCQVYVELPNDECRKLMINNYLKEILILPSAMNFLVKNTDGYSGTDIKTVCNQLKEIDIRKKMNGDFNYHLDINDVNSVLELVKSTVSKRDLYLMEIFRKQR